MKNPVSASQSEDKQEIGVYIGVPPERPGNCLVLYAIGSEDEKLVKIGVSSTIREAVNRYKAHTKFFAQSCRGRGIYIASSWIGGREDEDNVKNHYRKHITMPQSEEMITYHQALGEWLKFWRACQHCAPFGFEELEGKPWVDFHNWKPREDGNRLLVSSDDQQSLFQNLKGPFEDLLSNPYDQKNDYHTPDDIAACVRVFYYGEIDLDPASSDFANSGDRDHKGIRALRYFTQFNDGLGQNWGNQDNPGAPVKVYLNPPFGQWSLWVKKVNQELDSGRISEIIIYINNHTCTSIEVEPILSRATAMVTSKGRPKCWGTLASTPPDGIKLLYIGPNIRRFYDVFKVFGSVSFGAEHILPMLSSSLGGARYENSKSC